jgi:hypothetical protein
MTEGLFEPGGKNSSMRFVFVLISVGVFITLMALCLYITLAAIHKTVIKEWVEIGAFLTSLAAMITGIGWNKVQQKKLENNERSDQ